MKVVVKVVVGEKVWGLGIGFDGVIVEFVFVGGVLIDVEGVCVEDGMCRLEDGSDEGVEGREEDGGEEDDGKWDGKGREEGK